MICIILFTGIFIYDKFPKESSHEDEFLTVHEFENDFVCEIDRSYINFHAGDIVTIRDEIIEVESFNIQDIIINKTNIHFSEVTNDVITFTEVTFRNNQTLSFRGNRTRQFQVGKIVTFELEIKQYDFIPYHLPYKENNFPVDFDECHYNEHYILLYEALLSEAVYTFYNISFNVEDINNTNCLLSIHSINATWLDFDEVINEDHWESESAIIIGEDVRMVLWENGKIIDEFIPNKTNVRAEKGSNIMIVTEQTYYDGWFQTGDKVIITREKSGEQEYDLYIHWRHTFPHLGFNEERVIGNVSWKM